MSEFAGLRQSNGVGTFQLEGGRLYMFASITPYIPYDDAALYCKFLDYGGYRDWRLPTALEVISLSYLSYSRLPYGFYWAGDEFGTPVRVMIPSGTRSIIKDVDGIPGYTKPVRSN
jgi:hypothetical protein